MSWVEWIAYSDGLHKAKISQWEHTRQISWMLYTAHSDPQKATKNMRQWWPLPTDTGYKNPVRKKGKRITKAQMIALIRKHA